MKSKNVLNSEVVNVCGKVVGERQERFKVSCMKVVWYGRL